MVFFCKMSQSSFLFWYGSISFHDFFSTIRTFQIRHGQQKRPSSVARPLTSVMRLSRRQPRPPRWLRTRLARLVTRSRLWPRRKPRTFPRCWETPSEIPGSSRVVPAPCQNAEREAGEAALDAAVADPAEAVDGAVVVFGTGWLGGARTARSEYYCWVVTSGTSQ